MKDKIIKVLSEQKGDISQEDLAKLLGLGEEKEFYYIDPEVKQEFINALLELDDYELEFTWDWRITRKTK